MDKIKLLFGFCACVFALKVFFSFEFIWFVGNGEASASSADVSRGQLDRRILSRWSKTRVWEWDLDLSVWGISLQIYQPH